MKYIFEGVFIEENIRNFVNENIGENVKNFFVVLIYKDILIDYIVFYKYFGEYIYEIGWVFNFKYFNKGYVFEVV